MAQQTAVEWLEERIQSDMTFIEILALIRQAKQMESGQIEKALDQITQQSKRTLIVYNTKKTTEKEARHLLDILNCDDSTLWDNADHCGVQIIEVPIQGGNK